jgi:apolipoprotein D and lipocalin family protein
MTVFACLISFCAAAVLSGRDSGAATPAPLTTVNRVDLARYTGRWYEIARYPNRFQRECDSDTTANYALLQDGKVEVVNACRKKDGTVKQARGKAKVVDPSNARLKVTFFWPFYGDYWIIGLNPDYRWAVVGEPGRRYLWILSRTPQMSETDYQEALRQISAAGYDAARLIKTPQSEAR